MGSLDVAQELTEEINDLDLARQAQDAPVVRLASQILAKAIQKACSDVHIEPQDKAISLRYRLDGVLYADKSLPKVVHPP